MRFASKLYGFKKVITDYLIRVQMLWQWRDDVDRRDLSKEDLFSSSKFLKNSVTVNTISM